MSLPPSTTQEPQKSRSASLAREARWFLVWSGMPLGWSINTLLHSRIEWFDAVLIGYGVGFFLMSILFAILTVRALSREVHERV